MSRFTHILDTAFSAAFRPLAASPAFFFFMYLLGFVSHIVEVPFADGGSPYANLEIELFFDVYALCIVLCIVPLRLRRLLRGLFYIFIYPVTLIDVYCYVKFDSALTPSLLLLAGETNGNEASEFIRSYLNTDILLSPVGLILLVLAVHLCFNIALTVMRRKGFSFGRRLCSDKRRMLLIDGAIRFAAPFAGFAAVALFVWGGFVCLNNKAAMFRLVSADTIGKVEHELTRKDRAVLYLPAYRLAFSVYANMLTSKQIDRLIETASHADVDSCTFRSKNIVLIIGESYNRHHSQLYGYDKGTAPMQTERHRNGELVRFDDVVSPWNLTSFVFKLVFSLYSVGDEGDWCDYPLFPEIFRNAGYHVTFLTNQYIPKTREAVYDFSGGFFLNNPTLSKAQFDTRNTRLHKFDDGLLADYDSLVAGISGPQLTIFHLMGQHVDYRERVPQERKIYGPRDY
ncbi:MAG: sulfatase-like hydrolase/transferase, partial [Prevotella sp.]